MSLHFIIARVNFDDETISKNFFSSLTEFILFYFFRNFYAANKARRIFGILRISATRTPFADDPNRLSLRFYTTLNAQTAKLTEI